MKFIQLHSDSTACQDKLSIEVLEFSGLSGRHLRTLNVEYSSKCRCMAGISSVKCFGECAFVIHQNTEERARNLPEDG